VDTNRPFQFQKRSPLFIGVHNEPLSIVAVCVNNPDQSPVPIHRRKTAPTPTGFAEISAVLLIVVDHLRRRFARFKLCAHILNLRCLFFETRSELRNRVAEG